MTYLSAGKERVIMSYNNTFTTPPMAKSGGKWSFWMNFLLHICLIFLMFIFPLLYIALFFPRSQNSSPSPTIGYKYFYNLRLIEAKFNKYLKLLTYLSFGELLVFDWT